MFDPYRIGPYKENYYYQKKGSIIRKKKIEKPKINWTPDLLKPLVPLYLQNHLARPYSPSKDDRKIEYFYINQPGIGVWQNWFDTVDLVPLMKELPEDITSFTYQIVCNSNDESVHNVILFSTDTNPGNIYIETVIFYLRQPLIPGTFTPINIDQFTPPYTATPLTVNVPKNTYSYYCSSVDIINIDLNGDPNYPIQYNFETDDHKYTLQYGTALTPLDPFSKPYSDHNWLEFSDKAGKKFVVWYQFNIKQHFTFDSFLYSIKT